MKNSAESNLSWENFFLFISLMFLMLCSWRVCLPVAFSVQFFYTLKRRNVLLVLILFSICFDAYTGSILGVTWCMFMTMHLLIQHCMRSLQNASIFYQGYVFLIMLLAVEGIEILLTLFLHKNVNIILHLVEVVRALLVFFIMDVVLYIFERWKDAKTQ